MIVMISILLACLLIAQARANFEWRRLSFIQRGGWLMLFGLVCLGLGWFFATRLLVALSLATILMSRTSVLFLCCWLLMTTGCRAVLRDEGYRLLVDEALSFRGGSYFQCALLDETEKDGAQPKLYDLFALVVNGRLAPLEEADFYEAVRCAGLPQRRFEHANGPQRGPLGFFRLRGWREEWNDYRLYLQQDISAWSADKFGQAIVLKGVELDAANMYVVSK